MQVIESLTKVLEQSTVGTPKQRTEQFSEAFLSIIFDEAVTANGKSVVSTGLLGTSMCLDISLMPQATSAVHLRLSQSHNLIEILLIISWLTT